MASDYAAIRQSNREEYGTGIGRWGKDVLAIRYDDRTHFIFELLQNAEDALARRAGWQGSRTVAFHLGDRALRISHYGKPFDEPDVRGICGIAESTKDLTAIGRFGIGFKSVYAFADRPEVHSGAEDFAIENFVWPTTAPPVERADDETVISLPLKDDADRQVIVKGLQRLGARTLLFLRQIEEIEWQVEGGPSGLYLRDAPEILADGVRRITVIGQEQGKPEIAETWLVFSRAVRASDSMVGYVEIAFSITRAKDSARNSIKSVTESPLVAFFPTVLSTHLGFLVQGPYRTTPSRDNVPRGETWNQHLVCETAALLAEALRWLRDHALLDTDALRCLPLDRARFGETNMFAPLFEATRQALKSEPLLPRFDGGHVAACNARLARTQDLRELMTPSQLGALFGLNSDLVWLTGDITQDRTPELQQYLIHELDMAEITPEAIVPRLGKAFLETQSDGWILRLYEFLNGQLALLRQGRLNDVPLARLHDGTHVTAKANGQPQAFLPGAVDTGFPTVRRAVCATTESRKFLQSFGLTEPDAVDDVVRNVLPKYPADEGSISNADYEADIYRIVTAFATDSKGQREKLLAALRETAFVMAVDAGDGSKHVSKPGDLYLATERLKDLFSDVAGVLLVDDAYACLCGEDVRELLEACGAARYLKPISVDPGFTWEQQLELRRLAGHEQSSGQNDRLDDWSLAGFERLLGVISTLSAEPVAAKAKVLWEALGDVESRRGQSFFTGSYRWTHYGSYSRDYPSSFVRQLNRVAWVPSANNQLERPEFVVFESLGWDPDPFLQSKVRFKPPIIEALAKEAGIEPGVLDLLKKHGLTSVADLTKLLGHVDTPKPPVGGDAPDPSPSVNGPTVSPRTGTSGGAGARAAGTPGSSGGGEKADRQSGTQGPGVGTRSADSTSGRPFISYVATHPDEEERDPDGLDQAARMALEEKAITFILASEPTLQRTPPNNPGFDLFDPGAEGRPARWVEVKAMTAGLQDRPVGLSRTQFQYAQSHGEAYWLYVVERAGTNSARVIRIQDPVGRAQTFTFDHGWVHVAG